MNGHIEPSLKRVGDAFKKQLERSAPGGAALAVYHRGRPVVDVWGGNARQNTPWQEDTISVSFSTTKGVTSTLLHVVADRGLVDYDEKVATYWPEFAQAGKGDITVRHVLSHEAGMYNVRGMIDNAGHLVDWEHVIEAIEKSPAAHRPGEKHGYHAVTYGFLVGEIVQRATGKKFSDALKEFISDPLQMDGLYIGLPDKEESRVADFIQKPSRLLEGLGKNADFFKTLSPLLSRGPVDPHQFIIALFPHGIAEFDFNHPETLRTPIPAANGVFTARSLARLYGALANHGEVDGVQLISSNTVRKAAQVQNTRGDSVLFLPMQWRLGYHRVFTIPGTVSMQRAFGHFGFAGSGAWADPARHLSFAFTVNCGAGTPLGDSRIVHLTRAAAQCADEMSHAA